MTKSHDKTLRKAEAERKQAEAERQEAEEERKKKEAKQAEEAKKRADEEEAARKEREGGIEGEGTATPTIGDVISTLFSKGKAFASKIFNMKFFDLAKTPEFMKKLGLTGSKFTIRYGVISRHFGKDGSHDFTKEEWEQIPNALGHPFAIARLSDKDKGFRIYTTLKTEKGEYVVVGVDVKNAGRNMEINAISTLFGRRNDANLPTNEEIIYRSETITPEQEALLSRPNSDQYPTERELTGGKGTAKTAEEQGKGGKSSVKEEAAAHTDNANNSAYNSTPYIYTNKKGKTSNVSLLTFNFELTEEQERSVKEFAKERLGEGPFAPARGWKDPESGGWMFRREEDARKAAEMVGNEEAVGNTPEKAKEVKGLSNKLKDRYPTSLYLLERDISDNGRDGGQWRGFSKESGTCSLRIKKVEWLAC